MALMSQDVRLLRLSHQHIDGPSPRESLEDAVRWMGAIQAQDYGQAVWALGLRTSGAVANDIDDALARGTIVRTHVMRPTWHFVTPEDLRWMLALTAPRIIAGSAHRYRELQLDDELFARTGEVMGEALKGGVFLTRDELGRAIEDAGIDTSIPQRVPHILMRAELDGVICSGPRRGRQFTYALLEERVPQGRALDRQDAVAELVGRYFASHGPATVRDFAWWSGLTIADARAGLEALEERMTFEKVDGRTYWLPREAEPLMVSSPSVHLLPAFDEYTVAYADRRDLLLPEHSPQSSTVMLGPVLVVDGFVVGSWRRTIKEGAVVVEVNPFASLGEVEEEGVAAAAERYGRFLGCPIVFSGLA